MISFSPTLESAWVRFCLLLLLWWLESSVPFCGTDRSSPEIIDADAPDMSDRLSVELLDDTDRSSGVTLSGVTLAAVGGEGSLATGAGADLGDLGLAFASPMPPADGGVKLTLFGSASFFT